MIRAYQKAQVEDYHFALIASTVYNVSERRTRPLHVHEFMLRAPKTTYRTIKELPRHVVRAMKAQFKSWAENWNKKLEREQPQTMRSALDVPAPVNDLLEPPAKIDQGEPESNG